MKRDLLGKQEIFQYFKKKKIATMPDLKKVLGTNISMTVFRKLKELNYYSSCSNSGKYYTLKGIPKFDDKGLWFYQSVLFSLHGSLKETITFVVSNSTEGFSASELNGLLQVKPNAVLLDLTKSKSIKRKKIDGVYVYYSSDEKIKKTQELNRKKIITNLDYNNLTDDVLLNEVKASIILFFCTLNEKQRRLYAGLESLKLGNDKLVSELLNINVKTVSKGRKELLSNAINVNTIRKVGCGRKKKKRNSLI